MLPSEWSIAKPRVLDGVFIRTPASPVPEPPVPSKVSRQFPNPDTTESEVATVTRPLVVVPVIVAPLDVVSSFLALLW